MVQPDLLGRRVLITGGNSGIGRAAALQLARRGADVTITARDSNKGARAAEELSAAAQREVAWQLLDLASFESVRAAADSVRRTLPALHVLINNAGLVLSQRQLTRDGFEATFGTNHLGHFLFTSLLEPLLAESAPSRVVVVASDAHRRAPSGLDFDDLQSERGYSGWIAYCRSKLANVYFARELGRRWAGRRVTANALHPGVVASRFARDGDAPGVLGFGFALLRPFLLTEERGARTTVYCASEPALEQVTGGYFARCRQVRPSRHAEDDRAAARLWEVSEELVRRGRP